MAKRKTIDFLITYDHDARKQIDLEEFRDPAEALKAYGEREEQFRHNPRMEVVLLGAHSIDAIKVTHSNYFDESDDIFASVAARLGILELWQEANPA